MAYKVFRDPVHNLIAFEAATYPLRALVDTPEFQRLRRIRQLGLASYTYPTAEHSRFSHSLGAYHVARRMLAHLATDPPPGAPRLDDDLVRAVTVAALLHDIGHGPFSHLFERAFGGQLAHEEWSRRLTLGDGPLGKAVHALGAGVGEAAAAIWDHTYSPIYARKVVSSQLDADRMDYLLRDSLLTGARYGLFDLDWVIRSLTLAEVAPGAWDVAVDARKGLYAVEQFLLGRWYMYQQVYYHKSIRAAETLILSMLARFRLAELGAGSEATRPFAPPALRRLARGEGLSAGEFLTLDDPALLASAAAWAGGAHGGDSTLGDLAQRLLDRRLFKTVELAAVPESARARLEHEIADLARDRFGDAGPSYYAFDRAEGLAYDSVPEEKVWVIGAPGDPSDYNEPRALDAVSTPLSAAGRAPLSHRLVVAPELAPAARERVAGAARETR
jgi:HD superfamily phosphohydrolase